MFIMVFLAMLVVAHSDRSTLTGFTDSDCLNVSPATFVGSVRSTMGVLQHVVSMLSHFCNNELLDFRLANAVSDCLDLLDFSLDALNWSASATENPRGACHTIHVIRIFLSLNSLFSRSKKKKKFIVLTLFPLLLRNRGSLLFF